MSQKHLGYKPSKQFHVNLEKESEDELFQLKKEGDRDPGDPLFRNKILKNSNEKDEQVVLKAIHTKEKSVSEMYSSKELVENKENFYDLNSKNKKNTSKMALASSPKTKSFEKAYTELTYKIYQSVDTSNSRVEKNTYTLAEMLISPKKTKEIERKCMAMDKIYQEELNYRLMNEAKFLQDHYNNLASAFKEEEMKECTFNPKVHEFGEKRNLDEFLTDQKNFGKNKNEKKNMLIEKLKEEEKKVCPHQPTICTKSKELAEKHGNLHNNRLFSLQKQKTMKDHLNSNNESSEDLFVEKKKEKENSFVPKINKKSKNFKRTETVDKILYDDAMKRISKQKSQTELASKRSNMLSPKKSISQNSEKMLALKIIREFEDICSDKIESSNKMDYLTIGEVITEMGLIKKNCQSPQQVAQERSFIFDIWYILRGEENNGVSKRNLCLFILAVLGVNWNYPRDKKFDGFTASPLAKDVDLSPTRKNFDYEAWTQLLGEPNAAKRNSDGMTNKYKGVDVVLKESFSSDFKKSRIEEIERMSLGKYNYKGEWTISVDESQHIHKYYDLFYRNRLMNEELKKIKYDWYPSYKQQILGNSQILASQQREKVLNEAAVLLEKQAINMKIPENGEITHADLLVLQQKTKKFHVEKKYEEIKKNVLMSECSFHPKTNNYKTTNRNNNLKRDSTRYMNLYKLAKPTTQRKDRHINEIEYEKNCDECTFTPLLISPKKGAFSLKEIPNQKKFIDRMRNAFKEKQYIQFWKEGRGCKIPTREISFNLAKKPEDNTEYMKNYQKNYENKIEKLQDFKEKGVFSLEKSENSVKIPLLFVDVNLGMGRTERIIVYEGEQSEEIAERFSKENGLDENMKEKLKELLNKEISGLLNRIDEEDVRSATSEGTAKKV